MTTPRETCDYQVAEAVHHIHAFVDQQALNDEGPRVMVRASACTCGITMAGATSMACPGCGAQPGVWTQRPGGCQGTTATRPTPTG
jgi:hypothetical protein